MQIEIRIREKRKWLLDPKFWFIMIFIFLSDDTVLFGTNSNTLLTSIKKWYIVFVALLFIFEQFILKAEFKRSDFLFLVGFAALIGITMLMNEDYRFGYIYKFCLLFYGMGIASKLTLEEFSTYFEKCIRTLAVISLCGFLIVNVSIDSISFLPKIINIANTEFLNAFVFVAPSEYYSGFVRNYGVFREPGVYQMYLIFALLMNVYILKNKSLIRLGIYCVTVVTTMSTTGYIALAAALALIILDKDSYSKRKKGILIILLACAMGFLMAFTSIFSLSAEDQYQSVFGKLVNKGRETTVARMASVTENIRMFTEKPIWGVGITELSEKYPVYTLKNYGIQSEHNTNTVLIQFASHGLIYGLLWCWGLWRFSKRFTIKKCLGVFMVLMILFVGENLTYSGITSLFLLYGFCSI